MSKSIFDLYILCYYGMAIFNFTSQKCNKKIQENNLHIEKKRQIFRATDRGPAINCVILRVIVFSLHQNILSLHNIQNMYKCINAINVQLKVKCMKVDIAKTMFRCLMLKIVYASSTSANIMLCYHMIAMHRKMLKIKLLPKPFSE